MAQHSFTFQKCVLTLLLHLETKTAGFKTQSLLGRHLPEITLCCGNNEQSAGKQLFFPQEIMGSLGRKREYRSKRVWSKGWKVKQSGARFCSYKGVYIHDKFQRWCAKKTLSVGSSRYGGETKSKRKVNMVEILCIHVWKWKNDSCWNCPKNGGEGIKENDGMIHCKKFDKAQQ
jgi:hypothetical protein